MRFDLAMTGDVRFALRARLHKGFVHSSARRGESESLADTSLAMIRFVLWLAPAKRIRLHVLTRKLSAPSARSLRPSRTRSDRLEAEVP